MRETLRRLTLGLVLAIVTSVSVGDEVATEPDVRRGSRALVVDVPAVGLLPLHVPRTTPTGVVLLLHDRDQRGARPVLDALATSALVVQIDVDNWRLPADAPCAALADALSALSRRAQREAGLTTYHRPVVTAQGRAAALAHAIVDAGDPEVFPVGIGTASRVSVAPPRCALSSGVSETSRWTPVTQAALPDAVAAAVEAGTDRSQRTSSPLDRWLANFQLPLRAVWASQPRAALILMSDDTGLLQADTRLARALADEGVSVVSVDALHYFWQRRSPRDVAFEVRRLASALASTGLPVMVGGVGFGAETMAVTSRLVEGTELDALILVDPGPSAFFEVEPPVPTQLTLLRNDWSTQDAVGATSLPTLCASGASGRAHYLCQTFARAGHVSSAVLPGADREQALAVLVGEFVGVHVPMKVPKPPTSRSGWRGERRNRTR
jgi:type IV secretory pathway VirJ component